MFSTRAVTILLPILSILQPILAYSVSGTFYSCTTPSYALGGTILPGNSTSPSNCASACYSSAQYEYSSYLNGTCSCTNTNALGTSLTTGLPGACGSNAESWITHTSFSLDACVAVSVSLGLTGTSSDISTIFQTCSKNQVAIIAPANGVLEYSCSVLPLNLLAVPCTSANARIYQHPADATASGAARRRRAAERALKERENAASAHCPKGLTPCLVSLDQSKGYECIDVSSELESCGGCINGVFGALNETVVGLFGAQNVTVPAKGQDCSAIPGIALGGATCTLGRCDVYCRRGFSKEGGICVRK